MFNGYWLLKLKSQYNFVGMKLYNDQTRIKLIVHNKSVAAKLHILKKAMVSTR